MHPLLQSQLEQLGLNSELAPSSADWQLILQRIGMTYIQADNDRATLHQAAALAAQPCTGAMATNTSAEPPILQPDEGLQLKTEPSTDQSSNHGTKGLSGLQQSFLHANSDTCLLFDRDGQVLSHRNLKQLLPERLNSANTELTEAGEAGGTLALALGEQNVERLRREAAQVITSGAPGRTLLESVTGASKRTFEARLLPSAADAGLRVVVFIRDWSSIARSQRTAQLYKDMFDAASEGIAMLNASQRLVLSNTAFESMSGRSQKQLRSQESLELLDAEGQSLNTEIWSHVIYHDRWSGEALFKHDDGHEIPVWLSIDALKDQSGANTHFLVTSSDVSKLKETQQQLAHFAAHDQLTGLPNRSFFQEHLRKAILRSGRTGKPGALFFMDLDNFKGINDTLGHSVGDALLVEMGQRLSRFCRESELVARLGGDEFTLVLENLERAEDAAIVAQRVLKEFETPFVHDELELDMTCSIGVSVFPEDSNDPDQLITKADTAMYSAKQAGRRTFKFYTSQLTHAAVKNFNVESQLRRAIERDEMFIVFQPQIDMRSEALLGAEVLLRWDNEQQGMISPADFIPVAEASGLIEPIGEWVLDRTCQQIHYWQSVSELPYLVSVNVSRKQIIRQNFTRKVADVLAKYGLRGDQLEIEVTESAIATSEKIAIDNLHGLRELGCKIAIDDFGTGYSSLSSLKKFPLDRLKIDRSFIQDLGQDSNADAIIEAIIALAKTLGLGVIAEGVETEQQVRALLQRGCFEAQGFYYAKPKPASEFRDFVLKSRQA